MEISGSEAFHRFLFKRSIPKLAGEQNLLSKTFIYYDNKLAFLYITHIKLIAVVVCSLKLLAHRLQL